MHRALHFHLRKRCSRNWYAESEAAAKLPWYRGVTCKDVRAIMPTVLILIGGLLIMIFVIPYAFSSVIKQLENEALVEEARRIKKKMWLEAKQKEAELAASATEAAAQLNETLSTSEAASVMT